MQRQKQFKYFEHERCFIDRGEQPLGKVLYDKLVKYHGDSCPYFKLIHNGVQFNEYVGVIQVGNHTIEVLPKADKALAAVNAAQNRVQQLEQWQGILVQMVKAIWNFPVSATSEANLKLKSNAVLDLYFELFVKEVEYLVHLGLIKKYVREESILKALKGKLLFQQQVTKNLVHKESFYVSYIKYDKDHQLNQILHTALTLLVKLNQNPLLQSRIHNLLLCFQDINRVKVTEKTFSQIKYNRKNQSYQRGMEIARLLLLNYHPDVSNGNNHTLALMFDMNLLWEEFVAVVLRKGLRGFTIRTQTKRAFWKPQDGYHVGMIPDILIEEKVGLKRKYILDTKWKNLGDYVKPSPEDLRQMYVYHDYFDAKKVALVYPGKTQIRGGSYYHKDGSCYEFGHDEHKHCAVILIGIKEQFTEWKESIVSQIDSFIT